VTREPLEPVLVTGAAGGRQGSTGKLVAQQLLERGLEVRAFVHSDDARAAELRDLGAEVFVGDLREITSVIPALHGVRRAFFTYPVTAGMLDAVAVFAAAARQEGLRRVVDVSQLAADPGAGTPHMRRHWVAEQILEAADVGAVHLRAAVFFENLAVLAEVGEGREFALPLGPSDTLLPLVAASDVAGVATGLLTAPDGGIGPFVRLTGEVLSIGDVVATFGQGLRYTDIDPEVWRLRAEGMYQDAVAVEHLSHLWALFKAIGHGHDLYQVTAAIEQLGGRPPRTLRDFTAARAVGRR
jgi:uncharacterized protein YbjT (DUF2867 family)